jgi:branched-chain amino acid transport system permease protein
MKLASGLNDRRLLWGGVMLTALVLAVLPFFLAGQFGTSWVRISNLAILFILLALGLNSHVGYACLIDLG